jgi:phosphoribosyl 1,2-cyclic phosphate phosphodiesterase
MACLYPGFLQKLIQNTEKKPFRPGGIMKLHYLGTAAAEGIPGVFCACAACEEARKKRGKNLRTRSQALLDGKILLDFPPDSYIHSLSGALDLPAIRHLLITHSHMDHFFPEELQMRQPVFVASPPETLNIYGNRTVEAALEALREREHTAPSNTFTYARPFEPLNPAGYRVIPLPALHDRNEECLIYALEHRGKTLLYAHDTGIFPDSTWNYLATAGLRFDLVSLDCTMMLGRDGTNHMGLPDNIEVRSRLFSLGAADTNTVFVINHFSHNGGLNHDDLSAAAAKEGFLTAYDGMELEL